MEKYESIKIKSIPFSKGERLTNGSWTYRWNVTFESCMDFDLVLIKKLTNDKYKVLIVNVSERELIFDFMSREEMNDNESYRFQIDFFSELEKIYCKIESIEGENRERWPFFRFSD